MLRTVSRVFTAGFALAGINHFLNTRTYEQIMPPYIPAHREMVLLSGVAEVAGGALAVYPPTRPLARWWLIALLAAVSPVHVEMALHPERFPKLPKAGIYARLPLQLVMAYAVWVATDDTAWPTDAALG